MLNFATFFRENLTYIQYLHSKIDKAISPNFPDMKVTVKSMLDTKVYLKMENECANNCCLFEKNIVDCRYTKSTKFTRTKATTARSSSWKSAVRFEVVTL